MYDGLLLLAVLGTAYLGFALLALSQKHHWRQFSHAGGPKSLPRFLLRGWAGLAIMASLAISLLRDGPDYGALLWVTTLSLSAIAVTFTLAWRPKWLQPLAACMARAGARQEPASS